MIICGFLLILHGRAEIDSHSDAEIQSHMAAHTSKSHDNLPNNSHFPLQTHQDQHGCYHSHAAFVLVENAFNCQMVSAALVAAASEIPHSLALTSILRPPRA